MRGLSWHWPNSYWAPIKSPLGQVQRAVAKVVRNEWEQGYCFCDFYKPFTFLFVGAPLRGPMLFSISRKKQPLMPLYISICFVVICSQLAKPDRRLNWDIFSWKCVILSCYYSSTNEAQGREMSSTYYNGYHNYQHVLCTYYVPGTMMSFYRIKGLILTIGVWGRSENYLHFTFWYGETEAGQVSVTEDYVCIRFSGPRYWVIMRH